MSRRRTRRDFLRDSALVGTGFWVGGGSLLAADKPRGANDQINFACVGVGGKGSSDTDHCGQFGNVVAICDIDEGPLNSKGQKFPNAKKYFDFRKMFDEMGKQIDAVSVSTPDHTHAPASVMAMRLGKHVYCQKPLTHSVFEARTMREVAQKMKVCTQMGNQGTAENGLRTAIEVVRSGVIGPVKEVHVWTNRPIWPQGTDAILRVAPARAAALAALRGKTLTELPRVTVPKNVHWDEFLGPAPDRPYDPIYHPFSWRGWWDYGTGALGDMACHTANMAFMALKLGYPTTISAKAGEVNPESCPTWAEIVYEYPARDDMPPLKFTWYEGMRDRKRVLPPPQLFHGEAVADSGSLLVGEKGILYSPNDYGASFVLLPKKEFAGTKLPEQKLPRTEGNIDVYMKREWVEAIRSDKPETALSNFGYAGMLTEAMLLGNVAIRTGKKLEWDGPHCKVTNCPEAAPLVQREYRKGWEL